MAQLIVRDVEEEVVRRLKEQAALHSVLEVEKHSRILKAALREEPKPKRKPKRLLLRVVNPWESPPRIRTIDFGPYNRSSSV
jgi:plasmid stability protein